MSALLSVESVGVELWRGLHSVRVLDDVSLSLEPGEFAGICADRSAGKTTLTRVICGALRPDRGQVVLCGAVINSATASDERSAIHGEIGLATRRGPAMPELQVRAWIASSLLMSGSWTDANRRAQTALERVGVREVAKEVWADLSDGERTLVAIAHATARDPRLLMIDDLVAGLGALRKTRVMALLREFAEGGTTVLVTSNDASDFNGADRIWSLADGRLNGPPPRGLAEVVELRSAEGGNARSTR